LIKIKKVWFLCVLQGINFVFLFLNARFFFLETLFVLCPLFIWVGLMGGAAYVNVMHNMLDLPALEDTEREGAIVLSLISNDFGVLGAAILTLALDNTIFSTSK